MSKMVIDIILLLPDEINNLCIDLNTLAVERGETEIQLGHTDFRPHISLLMGVIEEEDKPKVIEKIKSTLTQISPLKLKAIEMTEYGSLRIERTPEIMALHEGLIQEIKRFLVSDIAKEYFYADNPQQVSESTVDFILNFLNEYSHERFDPHITLHTRTQELSTLPLFFQGSIIAFNHVGKSGTCRTNLSVRCCLSLLF